MGTKMIFLVPFFFKVPFSTHLVNIFFKKTNNELARFGQFIKYTLFRSPFSPHLVSFSAAEGPLLVLFSLNIRSPFGPHFDKFRSPFHVVILWTFIHGMGCDGYWWDGGMGMGVTMAQYCITAWCRVKKRTTVVGKKLLILFSSLTETSWWDLAVRREKVDWRRGTNDTQRVTIGSR